MKRFRIHIAQIIEVEDDVKSEDDVHDSLMDDLLDGQDSVRETSDTKLEFVPKEVLALVVQEMPPSETPNEKEDATKA